MSMIKPGEGWGASTAEQVLDDIRRAHVALALEPLPPPSSLKIICDKTLPPGTAVVSPDLFEAFMQGVPLP